MVEKMDESVLAPVCEVVYQLRRVGPPSTIRNSASLIRLQDDGEVTIGRGPAADYFVDSAITLRLISRIHATVKGERVPGGHPRFTIISSGLNGTYINECKMGCYPDNQQVLLEGDKITFGHPGCSSIQPGEFAPQLDSEFQFIFECVPALRTPQNERHRNHSRALPLNSHHTHPQKYSPVFKTSGIVPRLSDSPLSNASTSEKENEVTSSLCQGVRNILSNGGLDSKIKVVKYNKVLNFEKNKKFSSVGGRDRQPDPLFPSQTDTGSPKLCFYNSNGELTLCDPNKFLTYTDLVQSLKSLSSRKEHGVFEDNGSSALPSADLCSDSLSDLSRCPENFPAAEALEPCGRPGEDICGGIEMNNTTIVLSGEDDAEDLIVDDGAAVDLIVEDDDAAVNHFDEDGAAVNYIDNTSKNSHPARSDSSAFKSDIESAGVVINETGPSDDVNVIDDEGADIANSEFPESDEVDFGFEDIVEVIVTTENASDEEANATNSLNEDCSVSDKRDSDTDDDSVSSMPSLKSINSGVQQSDGDSQDSEDGMPSLKLMNSTGLNSSFKQSSDAAKSQKRYKENTDCGSIFSDQEVRKIQTHMTDLAFRDAALKLKSVCSGVMSKSPLSSSSSKSPPSSLLQSMTPSSKSPSSDLYLGDSPLYLHQSKSPPYISCAVKSPLKLQPAKPKSPPYTSCAVKSPLKLQPAKVKSPIIIPSKDQSFKSHVSSASVSRPEAPVTNTTMIILSSEKKHRAKSDRDHEKSKSRRHKDSLHKKPSALSSSTRPSSSLSSHSTSSEASVSHSRSSSSDTSETSSSDVSSTKSRSSSDESLEDSRSSASSSHSRPTSSSQASSKSEPSSRSSSQNSRHSSGSTTKKFFKDTVPNLYSSSDEDDIEQESKTEIVKKIYSPKGKQEDVPRRSSPLKVRKLSCPPSTTSSSKLAGVEAAARQVAPPNELTKSQSRTVRDLSPASSVSSNLSNVSNIEKKAKTEKEAKSGKKPEIRSVELPPVATTKLKPLALPQTVTQLSSRPRAPVTKQTLPSSPSLSLTSLPWMTDTNGPADSRRKSASKKTTFSKSNQNQKTAASTVANNKTTTSLSKINGQVSSVNGSLTSNGLSPCVPRPKVLLSASSFQVKTDKQPLSQSPSQLQPKTAKVRDKFDNSGVKPRSAKTDPASSASAGKDSTSVSGKRNKSGIAPDFNESHSKGKNQCDPKVDSVTSRGKRTRAQQNSSRINKDSDNDSDNEPASKRRDLRTDAARASNQSMSLRTPRTLRSDKPERQTTTTRKRKLSQTDSLTSETSKTRGKKSKQTSGAKRGRPPKNNRKTKKRISDSSSDDDDDEKKNEEEDDYDIDDLSDSDSEDSESWELPDGVQYYDNLCSAKKCLNPVGKQVDWVMCDTCEQWYHVVCVKCPIDVLKEDAQFHCGC